MLWTQEQPGAGDMGVVYALKSEATQRIGLIKAARAQVTIVTNEVDANALAAAAWKGRVERMTPGFDRLVGWLEGVRDGAATYAETVLDIRSRADALNEEIDRLRFARNSMYNVPDEAARAWVESRIRELTWQINSKETDLDNLSDERRAADNAFKDALSVQLSSAERERFASMQSLYGTDALAGNYAAFVTAREEQIARFVTMIDAAGDHVHDDEAMQDLAAALNDLAGDPTAAAAVWSQVGGEGTRELLTKLGNAELGGHDMYPYVSDAAFAIRASISAGSAEWTTGQAENFAHQLVGTGTDGLGGMDVVSFLFSRPDADPMGSGFASAVATSIDNFERGIQHHSMPGQLMGSEGRVWSDVPMNSGLYMFLAEEQGQYAGHYDGAYRDPMALVLDNLALDPDASLAWLTDSSNDSVSAGSDYYAFDSTGEARVAYWYGDRTWQMDGFAGASHLLNSALSTDGGLIASGGDYTGGNLDAGAMETHGQLMAGAFEAIADSPNHTFGPDSMSPAAQTHMADTLAGNFPWIAESTARESTSRDDGMLELQFFGADQEWPVPHLSDHDIAVVWGSVAGTEGGFAPLNATVNLYSENLLQDISSDNPAYEPSEALSRVAKVQGMHQGSIGGVDELHARLDDEKFAATMDLFSAGLGFVPVGELIGEGGALIVEHGAPVVFAGIDAQWGDSLSGAVENTNESYLAGRTMMEEKFFEVQDRLGDDVVDVGYLLQDYNNAYSTALGDAGYRSLSNEYDAWVDAND